MMRIERQVSSMWRYPDAVPLQDMAVPVTMGEGWTPLIAAPNTARALDCRALYIKDEAQNPTGTFKDRSAAYTISRLAQEGVHGIVLNSTGNASASFALYAARAGMRCLAVVPEDVLDGNLLQMQVAGAQIQRLADWSRASTLSQELAKSTGYTDVSAGRTPHRRQAKATMGYEIAEQLGWTLPDVFCFPTGGGTAVLAICDAFKRLLSSGVVKGTPPRLILSQYAGCAPIASAYEKGSAFIAPWPRIETPRGGMRTPSPALGREVLAALNGGAALAVEPRSACDAVRNLAEADGLIVGLETGSALDALARARATGAIAQDMSVVVVNTSTLLKSDPAYSFGGRTT